MVADILVVDDEKDIRTLICGILSDEGYQTRSAANSDEALTAIETRIPHLIFMDIWLNASALDGMELLVKVKELHPEIPIVMISGHGTIETAVASIKNGAYDFIEKPFKANRLLLVTHHALEESYLKRTIQDLIHRSGLSDTIVGESPQIVQLRQTIAKVAATNARVFLAGLPGTGKELVARTIHLMSPRARAPFITFNAANIAAEDFEAALFGVEHPSGTVISIGAFERAHKGTLFIEGISELPMTIQSKILRSLVDHTISRVNGTAVTKIDVRLLSASSKPLNEPPYAQLIHKDLFLRLAVVSLTLPSLSERRQDIPLLTTFFIHKLSTANGLTPRFFSLDSLAVLKTQDWPGNIRQLKNLIERLLIQMQHLPPEDIVEADMLIQELNKADAPLRHLNLSQDEINMPLREARTRFERTYLLNQIERFEGNISRTAEFVGMERSALHRKLKALKIQS